MTTVNNLRPASCGVAATTKYSRGTASRLTVTDAEELRLAVHRWVRCAAQDLPMGIPVTRECALPGCERLSSSTRAKDAGVYFDVSVLFAPRETRKPPAGEVRLPAAALLLPSLCGWFFCCFCSGF